MEKASNNTGTESACASPLRARARPRGRGLEGGAADLSFAALKQRQLVFLLTRQLVEAQFVRADQARSQRLWQEAAALDLDPDRIIHLLYGVANHADNGEMEAVDRSWRGSGSMTPHRRSWWAPSLGRLIGKGGGAWHQSAPPAATPAHQ